MKVCDHSGYFVGGGGGLCAARVINSLSGAIDAGGAFAIASAAIRTPNGAAGKKLKNARLFISLSRSFLFCQWSHSLSP
jgi:hypothetical protein